jgi:hypothetical protein
MREHFYTYPTVVELRTARPVPRGGAEVRELLTGTRSHKPRRAFAPPARHILRASQISTR